MALDVTPPGRDLLGAVSQQEPDGFAEILVAGRSDGMLRIYQNLVTTTGDTVNLQEYRTYDIYNDITMPMMSQDFIIQDAKFANLTGKGPGENDADIIVAISYSGPGNVNGTSVMQDRGKIVSYRATRQTGLLEYVAVSEVDLDYPAMSVDTIDYSNDGIPDVVVATRGQNNFPPVSGAPTPARAILLENLPRDDNPNAYGKLDIQDSTVVLNNDPADQPTYSVLAGNFFQLTSGSTSSTGNENDFVAFSGFDGLTVGSGNGAGDFTFDVSLSDEPVCGDSNETWFGSGNTGVELQNALVEFDPWAIRDASFVTESANLEINLLHYDPLSFDGNFYHLCDSSDNTLDVYNMQPMDCTNGVPFFPTPETDTRRWIASGHLNNDDTYEDLIFLDPNVGTIAFLLGRGSPDPVTGRILAFDNCFDNPPGQNYFIGVEDEYAPATEEVDYHRAICADLNNDNLDEIIVSHSDGGFGQDPTDFVYKIVVFTNTTGN